MFKDYTFYGHKQQDCAAMLPCKVTTFKESKLLHTVWAHFISRHC